MAENRMCFPSTDAEPRTDTNFRLPDENNAAEINHIKEYTILQELPIDMIKSFVVADSLHLLELGNMKKYKEFYCNNVDYVLIISLYFILFYFERLLIRWTKGGPGYEYKWSKREIELINRTLRLYNAFKPKEIHRSVRGLDSISFWKGTEYRSFLLYFSIVLLKKHLLEEEYNNFLRLYCATRICYIDVYKPFIEIARKWFVNYIEGCISLYGEHSISSNVHNLAHVVDDVKEFGCLQDISTYPFENLLQFIKLRVKQKNLPLEQVTRRLIELSPDYNRLDMQFSDPIFPQAKHCFILDGEQVFREVIIDSNFTLSTKKRSDSWFLTYNGDVVLMKYVTTIDYKNIMIHGITLKSKTDYFIFPISSTKLDIYKSDGELNIDILEFNLQSVKAKMMCLPIDQDSVFIPLLHTIK